MDAALLSVSSDPWAPAVDAALQRLLEDGRARAALVDPRHARLWEALESATRGGKRIRPALLVAAHDGLGGECPIAAAEVGAALELLHTAFLIHDDVIDDEHHRRGRPNVSGTFRLQAERRGAGADAAGYGRAAGVLAGDLALTTALRGVATCSAATPVVHRLLDLFDLALHTTAAGELADVRFSMNLAPATLAESLAMAQQKTSAYSFTLPLQAGGLLAEADADTITRLGEAGRAMGTAFQLLDDLTGVFGDPAHTGKSTTSDLYTRKQTPLLVHARRTPFWDRIQTFVGRRLDPHDLATVRDLLTVSGSRRFVAEVAEEHMARAHLLLDEVGPTLPWPDWMSTAPLALATHRIRTA